MPASKAVMPPNQTLYVSNLIEKIPKDDLRRQLYMLFSPYGAVLDIVALKTSKMRGQAHIVFKDIATAAVAMRALEGTNFFGKELRISYAKGKSNFIAKLDGTFKMPGVAASTRTNEPSGGDKGTALQQSVFGGVPGKTPSQAQGVKRTRDENDSEMEESEDEAEMEMDESD